MHFFNPVPVMKLVEVVTGLQTDPQVTDRIDELAVTWGKQVARVKNAPGFIVNRVARGFYGEALRLLQEQAASPATLDAALRGAGQFRMGPFELMDLIGNDVNAAVTRSVWTAFNFDPRFEPSRIQDELVAAGRYGRKRGHGFYSYAEDAAPPSPASSAPATPGTVGLRGPVWSAEGDHRPRGHRRRAGSTVTTPSSYSTRRRLVTRGLTAHAESAARGGAPVVVIDRWISAENTTGLAVAASHPEALSTVAALLDRAGSGVPGRRRPGTRCGPDPRGDRQRGLGDALHGVATADDIDVAMRLGTNYPAGPFEWTTAWGTGAVLGTPRPAVGDVPRHSLPYEPSPPGRRRRLTRQTHRAPSSEGREVLPPGSTSLLSGSPRWGIRVPPEPIDHPRHGLLPRG